MLRSLQIQHSERAAATEASLGSGVVLLASAAGLGIRETTGLITDNGAAFVPHRIPD